MSETAKSNTLAHLETFLNAHVIAKESTQELTHTEYGQFSNRKFHIPDSEYDAFMKLLYRDVIKCNRTHNIIERQRIFKNGDSGPLLVDLDFQFASECVTRLYTQSHLYKLVQLYLDTLSSIFEMDEDIHFHVILLEKPSPRVIHKGPTTIVKDGIHLIFSIAVDPLYHAYIRAQVLEKLPELWSEFPIINAGGWDDVIDSSISSGTNGWLAPNCRKRDDTTHYAPTLAYNVYFDTDSNKWQFNPLLEKPEQLESYLAQHYKQLFIRNKNIPKLSLEKESIGPSIQAFRESLKKPAHSLDVPNTQINHRIAGGDEDYQISVQTIRQIKNATDLKYYQNLFLDNLPSHKYEIRESYEYCMTLPPSYYEAGSYLKWVKVGFALRNTNHYLLIAWIIFSAQSKTFQYTDIGTICDYWVGFNLTGQEGVTKRSLMYWSKQDAPDAFLRVVETTVDYYLNQSIETVSYEDLNSKTTKKGCCDFDIATVVYHLKKGLYVSSGIRTNEWFSFNGNFWIKDDMGTSLRHILSTEVRGLYVEKAKKLFQKAGEFKTPEGIVDPENEEYKIIRGRANLVLSIATRLGNTSDKDKIMRECRELFYEKDFEKKLDQYRNLLCFTNGVIDFTAKTIRKGCPEDYISKCTQMEYKPLDEDKDQIIIEEIKDYFHKLFPVEELCEYMWDHLASVLLGDTNKTQCLHYYTGVGQNGKSMLVKFIQMILGDYATELDVSFFVTERPARGKATPELLALVGARFAVTAEPSEGEKLVEGPMKQLTSGTDKISYRGLFKEQDSFIPQVHSVIMANHFIPVKSRDHGTWRRIRVIQFMSLFTDNPVQDDPHKKYQFKKEDNFDLKFKQWAVVFMAMLVERAFKNQGHLPLCKYVEEESKKYQKSQDFIAEFMEEMLVEETSPYVLKKSILLKEFANWYQERYTVKITGKNQELINEMDKKYGNSNNILNPGWARVKIKIHYDNPKQPETDTESVMSGSC